MRLDSKRPQRRIGRYTLTVCIITGKKRKRRCSSQGLDGYQLSVPSYHNSCCESPLLTDKPELTKAKNFFSTQFVHTTTGGDVQVSARAWLLAAIAVPLTLLTIGMWWIWVQYTNGSLPSISRDHSLSKLQQQNKFWSTLLSKKKQRPSDIECGIASDQSEILQRRFCDSGVGTWSTIATPVKSG